VKIAFFRDLYDFHLPYVPHILYLTNCGQNAYFWTFWTYSYRGELRNLGGNRDCPCTVDEDSAERDEKH
jgi:hypothetical protein